MFLSKEGLSVQGATGLRLTLSWTLKNPEIFQSHDDNQKPPHRYPTYFTLLLLNDG